MKFLIDRVVGIGKWIVFCHFDFDNLVPASAFSSRWSIAGVTIIVSLCKTSNLLDY
jgi:hypothetical protein